MPADILVGAPFCVWLRHATQDSTPTKMQLHSALRGLMMALGFDGCTDNEELKNWFLFIFEHQEIQEALIACETQDEFANLLMELSKQHNFNFPREALDETIDGSGTDHFPEIEKEDKWIHKLLQMGWSPLGYTR